MSLDNKMESSSSISEEEFLQLAKELGMEIDSPSHSDHTEITGSIDTKESAQIPGISTPEPASYAKSAPASQAQSVPVSQAQFAPLVARDEGFGRSNLDIVLDVTLKVAVELGRTNMTIRDILSLNSGSVVELDRLAGEPVDILINEKLIAKGEVVVVDENFGVRVTDIVSPTKRIASLKQ